MTALKSLLQFGSLALLLALGGCGGSSSSSGQASGGMGGSGSGSGQYAEGGMGGSGSGTSSGYGSIYLNDNRRHYPIDPNADVFLDGQRVAPDSINHVDEGLPLGMTLEFLLAGDANATLTGGTAIRIRADHRVIGPVTDTEPLEVLGQPVLVTSETVLEGLTVSGVDNLAVGDRLKVDGLVNAAGTIRATRLEAPATLPAEWQLMGRAKNVNPSGSYLEIGGQAVELVNATKVNCDTGSPVETGRVLIRAMADSNFQPGDTLVNTLTVECLPEGLSLFADNPPVQKGLLPATVDGIITGAPDLDLSDGKITLDLNGQQVLVQLDQLSEVLFGTLDQLKLGSRIEVDGTLDLQSGVIQARSIRFRDPLVKIQAPIDGGILGELLLTLGIEVRSTPATASSSFFTTGPDTGKQVLIEGFATDDRAVYAERILDIGTADASNVSLLAPVTDVDDSLDRVGLLGSVFDTTTVTANDIELADITGTVTGTLCGLLGFILDCSAPAPELEGTVYPGYQADLSGATWNAAESRLESGNLIFTLPDA